MQLKQQRAHTPSSEQHRIWKRDRQTDGRIAASHYASLPARRVGCIITDMYGISLIVSSTEVICLPVSRTLTGLTSKWRQRTDILANRNDWHLCVRGQTWRNSCEDPTSCGRLAVKCESIPGLRDDRTPSRICRRVLYPSAATLLTETVVETCDYNQLVVPTYLLSHRRRNRPTPPQFWSEHVRVDLSRSYVRPRHWAHSMGP